MSNSNLADRAGAKTSQAVVYLLDDDLSIQRALTRLMRSAGLNSVAFSNVDEFLEFDFQRSKACIIADVHMPGTSALELPARIQALGCQIPVIFLTADYSDETRERIRRAGGNVYFGKPVDDRALLDMIQWIIAPS